MSLFGGRPLVIADQRVWTYRELAEWSRRLASGLTAAGIVRGDKVALLLANYPEFVALKYAISRLGAIAVPINIMNRRDELRYVLKQSESAMLVTMDQFRGVDYLAALDEVAAGWEQSGGGSALLAAPAAGVSLADKQEVTRALLQSGATIEEINRVRKHLSRIKGGRLAVAAEHAGVTTWIISDVPGDNPSYVSSGPTVADHSSLEIAREIVDRYQIPVPESVAAALNDPANETPAPDTLGLAGSETIVIARARDALSAAGQFARDHGFVVTDLGDQLQAEARHLGASHAALARRLGKDGARRVILSGGETTVTVTNKAGRGGRNLEYCLGLAMALDGAEGIWALACDTDGIDGTEDAAGAIVTPTTLQRARDMGMDPARYLAENNAYLFFKALGDLIVTGPTLTNVNDFRAILINGSGQ